VTLAIDVHEAFRIHRADSATSVALQGLTLQVEEGELVVVLGPSGSGKTTLLRTIAGFDTLSAGVARVLGTDVGTLGPGAAARFRARNLGLLDQHYARALSPDLTCVHTVGLGLELLGAPRRQAQTAAAALLERVGLGARLDARPALLSGGEQQRVALARALAPEPRVLLLDEPLGSLDRRLRDRLLDDLAHVFDEVGVTAVYVTHDQTEAFALGDRVAVMRAGRIVQVATPDDLWAQPLDADVARFLGIPNVDENEIVRPEAVRVSPASGAGAGVVESAVRTGPIVRIVVRLDDGRQLEAVDAAIEHPAPGDRVDVELDPAGIVRLG
jgi:thiamine transport system ATP-binding protein